MDRIIMHIDVNNAFLSWTAVYLLKNGSKYDIRDSYAVIGGNERTRTGVVLAKSIPAKKMGVVTGETLYQARKKCPALRNYPMNYPFYTTMSKKMFKIISRYSPDIEIASIDECYLDYTKVRNLHGDPLDFAKRLQREIYDRLGFTVNIGIANNKLCAKMASDFSKPNKIHTLFSDEIEKKMWPLPIEDLFGIGKKSAAKLRELNINTIYDLAHADVTKLKKYFKNQSRIIIEMANGIDDTLVNSAVVDPKGISNELTLEQDVTNIMQLYRHLLYLSEKLGIRLRHQKKYTCVVGVVLKDNNFKKRSRQKKLVNPTNLSNEIYEVAKDILREMWDDTPVRLIGIKLDKLVEKGSHQMSLFDSLKKREDDTELEKIVDSLKEKYGHKIIRNASLDESIVDRKEVVDERLYKIISDS